MLEIKGFQIGRGQPCFIVAEIGQNHQGEMEIAKKMIRIAKVGKLIISCQVVADLNQVD